MNYQVAKILGLQNSKTPRLSDPKLITWVKGLTISVYDYLIPKLLILKSLFLIKKKNSHNPLKSFVKSSYL